MVEVDTSSQSFAVGSWVGIASQRLGRLPHDGKRLY